jgi:pimeloyl-ACP methyl ester carboxylesterase
MPTTYFTLFLGLAAQLGSPGPQVVTYFSNVDDTDQPYGLYLPKNFDPSRKWPLVVGLHGEGSNHRLHLRRLFGKGNLAGQTDAEASRYMPPLPDVPFIVATPLARGSIGYQGLGERDVYDVLEDVKKRFPIDEDRIYLTGHSMGGGGALWLALTRPDLWAAVALVCPDVPPGLEELSGNALGMALRIYQGALDPLVPVESARRWHKRLLDAGANVEYFEYPGVKHNAWDTAYKDAAVFSWFGQQKRNRMPGEVRLATRSYAYRSAWWIVVDALAPGELASVEARMTGPEKVAVTTRGVDGFTLQRPGSRYRVDLDGQQVSGMSFRKTPTGWESGRYEYGIGEKRPGSEGPLGKIFAGRVIFVYGAGERERAESLARRLEEKARPYWQIPIVSDSDLTQTDLVTSNLVLFGTRETNRWISLWAGRLPLHLNPGAADYGLFYAADVGVTRVAVCSGVPWWDEDPGKTLPTFGDYVLFRGSLKDVVASGYFDKVWKTKDERLRSSGAVSLH